MRYNTYREEREESTTTLEERVASLEQEVTRIKSQLCLDGRQRPPTGAWRETVGMFRGDPVFREILEKGKAIREAEQEPT